MNRLNIENFLRKWLEDNGYSDFSVSNYGKIYLEGYRKIPKRDLKRLAEEFDLKFDDCTVEYTNPFKKDGIISVEYSFTSKSDLILNEKIQNWMLNKNQYCNVYFNSKGISFCSYNELSEEFINDFETEFNVKLREAEFGYKPSDDGCKNTDIWYRFEMC